MYARKFQCTPLSCNVIQSSKIAAQHLDYDDVDPVVDDENRR